MRFIFKLVGLFISLFSLRVAHASFSAQEVIVETDLPKCCDMPSMHWEKDYTAAKEGAAKEKIPLLLAFIKSEGCPWSQKLKEEILAQQNFIQPLKDKLKMVWIDITDDLQSQQWQTKFGIDQTPFLLLITAQEEKITSLGYLPVSAKEFVDLILVKLKNFEELKTKCENQNLVGISCENLEYLYAIAKELGATAYLEKLYQVGKKNDKGPFFLLEEYGKLLQKKKPKDPEVLALKKKIISRDPKNSQGALRSLAFLEFTALTAQQKKNQNPKIVVEPLLDYIEKFGQKDQENIWKLQMAIAQFFFSKDRVKQALEYASASLEAAPDEAKPKIAEAIHYLSTRDAP